MQKWKIEKFCATAFYIQLAEVRKTLQTGIQFGTLKSRVARWALEMVEEEIELREVLGDTEDESSAEPAPLLVIRSLAG